VSDHDHRGEYAGERHDHDLDYAEKHHRHYDEERDLASVRRDLDHVIADLRELREDLTAALGRIQQLEEQTPEARQAEYEADVALADSEAWRSTLADYQVASGSAEYVDEELSPVVCLRVIMTSNGPRQCRLPVDHEPDPACPGNPHARPAQDDFVQDRHADLDPNRDEGDQP
jgi:hypothetical protein